MKRNCIYRVLVFSVITFLITACVTVYDTVTNRNLTSLYTPGDVLLHPEFTVYHQNDSISFLYFKIFPSELLFHKNAAGYDEARVKIYYQTLQSYASIRIIDSSSFVFSLRNQFVSNRFVSYIPLKVKKGNKIAVELKITDLNRGQMISSFVQIDKTEQAGDQNYQVLTPEGTLQFQRVVKPFQPLRLKSSQATSPLWYFRYYSQEFDCARPPCVRVDEDIELKPDSIWSLILKDTTRIFFSQAGMYLISNDSSFKQSLTLFDFGETFPRVQSAEELLKPLRYLTSAKEFKRYSNLSDPKIAIDSFWLSAFIDPERAREAIRVYYNRVQLANYYFSSFMEGWKTDRGMIYSILGAPTYVYKTDSSERWIYGKKAEVMSLDFTFVKNNNPYTTNDYLLIRSDAFERSWFQAVNTWRGGHIYSIVDDE